MNDKLKGKLEEMKGKITGNKAEELKGKARQKVGDARDVADELRRRPERGPADRPGDETPEDPDLLEPR